MMENEKELNVDGKVEENPSVTPEKGEELESASPDKQEVVVTADDTPATDSTETQEETSKVSIEEAPKEEVLADENSADVIEEAISTVPEEVSSVTKEAVEDSEAMPADEVDTPASNSVEESVAVQNTAAPEVSDEKITAKDSEKDEEPTSEKLDSEEDLKEKEEEESHEEEEEVDYSTLDKQQLVDAIRELSQSPKFIPAEKKARLIKPFFDQIKNSERQAALDKFIADGGEEGDFHFKHDELTERFDANYRLIHDNKVSFVREQEGRKDDNLEKKQEILERLREFVDSEETNIQFDAFKAIQDEWKAVGPIPGAQVRTLWANYNALVDRFFDNRHIYFELKELDRKKNLGLKQKLCEKAEALADLENVSEAIKELNELHHEYKHVGPVPNSEREELWQRFKAASDAIYDRRKGFIDGMKEELEANFVLKQELVEKVKDFLSFDSDKIKDWNKKTKELQELQENWEAIGGLPRAKAKEVNKAFWASFKGFFNNKGQFFKKLDSMRVENLEKKKTLVAKAEELKENTDWQKTSNDYKRLQADWREIGPVPEKFRESIYREFKSACDHFFQQKRESMGDIEKDFQENLKKKEAICDEIEKLAKDKSSDLDQLRALQAEFNEIGFVPRNDIPKIKSKYSEAVDKYINSLEGVTNEDRQKIRLENQINKIKSGANAGDKMYRKEQAIRKQIGQLENDIALWKNNMEFFAQSKTADKLKDEFDAKIENATNELRGLKTQLKIVRSNS